MAFDYPWPEELNALRLDWVTPLAHQWDAPDAAWAAPRVAVAAVSDEIYEREI